MRYLLERIELMKKQKIKVYCHEKDCLEFKIIEWSGEFINRFYCEEHAHRYMSGDYYGKKQQGEKA